MFTTNQLERGALPAAILQHDEISALKAFLIPSSTPWYDAGSYNIVMVAR